MHDACTIALSTTTIRTTDRDGVSVVEVSGEVDVLSGGPILAILTAQLDRHPRGLVADLTGITFFGSTGISMLVDAAAHARDRGIGMVVVADNRAVLRPLRIIGVDRTLTIRPTTDLALAALPARTSVDDPAR